MSPSTPSSPSTASATARRLGPAPSIDWTDPAALRAYLRQVRILQDPIDGRALVDATPEMEEYVEVHGRSAALSLAMLQRHLPTGRRLRVLELGGAPYYFSVLMARAFDIELTAANVQAGAWPGEPADLRRGIVELAVPDGDGRLDIAVEVFNIEKDPFPFPDDHFDVVLCMEVLEHLCYSPSHMLAESHRVLAPGGLFFLTVPNFLNIKRLVNMALGRPTEYPYSGYGVYGRHAREFAPGEVGRLFEACHYRVLQLATANVWPTFKGRDPASRIKGLFNAMLNGLTALPLPFLAAKREYILCAAQAEGEALCAYPDWLYVHRHLYPPPPHGIAKGP